MVLPSHQGKDGAVDSGVSKVIDSQIQEPSNSFVTDDSPVSSFRRDLPCYLSSAQTIPSGSGCWSMPTRAEIDDSDIERKASHHEDESMSMKSIGSWDVRIAREIQIARQAAARSVVSDPTGIDRTVPLLQKLLVSQIKKEDGQQEKRKKNYRSNGPAPSRERYPGRTENRLGADRDTASRQGGRTEPRETAHKRICDNLPRTSHPNAQTGTCDLSPDVTYSNGKKIAADLVDEKKESDVNTELRDGEEVKEGPIVSDCTLSTSLSVDSDLGSMDGLPCQIQRELQDGPSPREHLLQTLDGIQTSDGGFNQTAKPNSGADRKGQNLFDWWSFNFLWGASQEEQGTIHRGSWRENDDTLGLLGCANIVHREDRVAAMPSLVRVTTEPPLPSYAETIRSTLVDPRMQDWVESQHGEREKPPGDGSYYLGMSRTVVVHEIARGSWTWCTAWSPDGNALAVASENHHLAVIDTSSSPVWRVRHDQRIKSPVKNNTTHSIRSIAWGANFIAIGGTGNAVSILSPVEPYTVLHTIKGTGFVGALDWKVDSTVLAIGSRLDKAMIVRVGKLDREGAVQDAVDLDSDVLHTIACKHWVNCVAFSPGGSCLAIGDASGCVSVYGYMDEPPKPVEVNHIKSFTMEDSALDVEWSPDGKWLYAGGEDFIVSVIDTNYWEVVHRINRQRWVQCIASSHSGSHLAVGGVSSEISILDVNNGWDSAMGVQLKGLVPLSAKWHPKDQYLALTGQNNSILVVETTNARHVRGHHLHSSSPILAIEFSPDGRMAIIGNESGVVTFFSLSGSTFVTAYELVVTLNDRLSIQWSFNGMFVVVGSKESLIVIRTGLRRDNKLPPNASGISIQKVLRNFGEINDVSIEFQSQYLAVSGDRTWILDATADFTVVRDWKNGVCYANAWSPDGRWLATIGQEKLLTIYDTSDARVDRWRAMFSLKCGLIGRALAWGPMIVHGLLYLAFGGDDHEITVMEIRTYKGAWEMVMRIPRDGSINCLDWGMEGMLAAAIGNGTISVIDLSYLQSGVAVNEMDYNWQRQATTCFTEIRRNRGTNAMHAVRWIPSAPGSDNLVACGGSDGEVEIIDLTERRRCRGYIRAQY